MEPVLEDDDLMRRFLVGRVSTVERESIEKRFLSDSDYFDALCALEEEMMLDYTRGALPRKWRRGFKKRVLNTAARRRHVEELAGLADALGAPRQSHASARRTAPFMWLMFPRIAFVGAGVALAALAVTVSWRRGDVENRSSVSAPSEQSRAQIPTATFILLPGQTRSELRQTNVFAVPAGTEQVRLQVTLPGEGLVDIRGYVRVVGGATIAGPAAATIEPVQAGTQLTWTIPSRLLMRGDYLFIVTRGDNPEPIATRFFTVDE